MNKETEEKLVASLATGTTELLPFLPYLFQDVWELGSNPVDMIHLIKNHMNLSANIRILDLACGKGAVAVKIAQSLNIHVKGIDLIPEFIEYAKQKAKETGVETLCHFTTGDINEAIMMEKDYDCVILGAVGDVLGNQKETLRKLKATVTSNGYILVYDVYILDIDRLEKVKYKNHEYNYEYLTYEQWLRIFSESDLTLIEAVSNNERFNSSNNNAAIALRANELMQQFPEKKKLFEGYINSQSNEYGGLENSVVGLTWMLQKA